MPIPAKPSATPDPSRTPPSRSTRGRVEDRADRVCARVEEARAADRIADGLRVCPVADSRRCGRKVRNQSQADQPLAGGPVSGREDIEQRSARERSDHHVGQHRMKGMTEPGAAQRVLDRAGRQVLPDRLPYGLGDCVKRLGRLDLPEQWLERGQLAAEGPGTVHCGALPQSGSPTNGSPTRGRVGLTMAGENRSFERLMGELDYSLLIVTVNAVANVPAAWWGSPRRFRSTRRASSCAYRSRTGATGSR